MHAQPAEEVVLSVVIPAYNEGERIHRTLRSVAAYFERREIPHEVLVVDDGSRDDTAAVVESYRKTMPTLRLLRNGKNRGKGYTVRRGMLAAKGMYRLFMDADNSVDISHLDAFSAWLEHGYSIVIGSIRVADAKVREGNGRHRRMLSNAATRLVRVLVAPDIRDTQRGFKLFAAEAAKVIFSRQTIDRFGFDMELLLIARLNGLRIKELPVSWDNPTGSKVTLFSYAQVLGDLVRITLNRLRGIYAPRRVREKVAALATPLGEAYIYKGKRFVHHAGLRWTETAFFSLLGRQKYVIFSVSVLFIFALAIDARLALVTLMSTLTVLYFFDLLFNAFLIARSYQTLPEITVAPEEIAAMRQEDYPTYTVLCPLYKETEVLPQFVRAMQRLEYPREKLQILLLLEENDAETIEAARYMKLPPPFETVIVPHSEPKTKPKAMNYGLKRATGTHVVVYDAEDMPESDQLKKAVVAFSRGGEETVCVQAKLNFYNPRQNVLTRVFTAEYSLWFDLVLTGLQSIGAPIPLGGTSNHFKAGKLRAMGGWDAFNVTEDCDLGIRIAKHGYRTAIVNSTTYEEANSETMNWLKQRSRWIKGYMQTYFVHMRTTRNFFRTSWRNLVYFQLTVGGKVLSLFINPLMWVLTICYFVFRVQAGPFIQSLFPTSILYLGAISLVFGNFLYFYLYMIGCVKRGYDDLVKYGFLVPLYWIGMSIAGWKAIYELIVKPHYWEKTRHGLHLRKT